MASTPSPRTQESRRVVAERRLLEAAAELIGEAGPGAVTLEAVGERAGYSRGLATHYFGSKGGLMKQVADAVTEQVRDVLREGGTESVTAELVALVRTYIEIVADPPPMNRARLVLFADAVSSGETEIRPVMVAADRAFRQSLVEGIQLGVSLGEFPDDVDDEGLAAVIIGMLRGVTFQSMIDDELDLQAAGREIERLLLARLAKAPAKGREKR